MPASCYNRAQQVRQYVLALLSEVDGLIAPATPSTSPNMGEKILMINGDAQTLRPNLGYFTHPICAIGLPWVAIPTHDDEPGLTLGVQIIAAPWRQYRCLPVVATLESLGYSAAAAPL